MDATRLLPALTVASILLVTLLSGPLFGAVDLTAAESRGVLGEGSADVQTVSVPHDGRLIPTGYADRKYLLSLPSATVDISNLSGNPMLVYEIRIRELGYITSTTHFLDERFTGRQPLTLEEAVLNRTSLDREVYDGELLIIKRTNEDETTVYRGKVTLRVGQ